MRVAGGREIRGILAALLGGDEPIPVTPHGKLSGLDLPLCANDRDLVGHGVACYTTGQLLGGS